MKNKKSKKFICIVILICVVSFFSNSALIKINAESLSSSSNGSASKILDHVPGEVIVLSKLSLDDKEFQTVRSKLPEHNHELFLQNIKSSTKEIVNMYLFNFENEASANEAMGVLKSHESNIVVQHNYIYNIADNITEFELPQVTASDPQLLNQWGFSIIEAQEAWDKSFFGSTSIKVGVLDTGLISYHEDLGSNVDMTLAKNVVDETADTTDIHGHGTMVTGIIAAEVNELGIAGICDNVSITPIKISFDSQGHSNTAYMAAAVNYASQNGFDVLNLSYSISSQDPSLINAVSNFDGVLVTAAGNDGVDIDDTSNGNCNNLSNWIVVGASTGVDTIYSGSNYGKASVDLFAPGVNILSLKLDSTGTSYSYSTGTSCAAPHVTAAAALIMSKATHYTPAQIRTLLINTADDCNAFTDKCVSDGRLNINNAVDYLYSETRPAYSKGDVNGDGKIDTTDYAFVRNIFVNNVTLTAQQFNAADIDFDGSITTADYLRINSFLDKTYYFAPY